MSVWRLTGRLVVGGIFVGHGLQKLTGWFDGPGLAGTEQMMESLNMRPTRAQAMAAGLTETVSGGMLAAGLCTPAAAAGITGVMATAVRKVHGPHGVWNSNGGYEYNAVVVATVLMLAEKPGRFAIDAAFGRATWGSRWALAALAAGLGASAAAIRVGGHPRWMPKASQ